MAIVPIRVAIITTIKLDFFGPSCLVQLVRTARTNAGAAGPCTAQSPFELE